MRQVQWEQRTMGTEVRDKAGEQSRSRARSGFVALGSEFQFYSKCSERPLKGVRQSSHGA